MDDARIRAHLLAMGRYDGDPRPFRGPEVFELCVRIEEDCAARAQAVADRYRPIADGRVDHQAQIARNAALSCVAAIRAAA